MAPPCDLRQPPLRFTLERRPLTSAERAVFARDLATLDLDDRALQTLDGFVSTGTRDDIPYLMLGYRADALVFAAHPIVSRRTMRCFFPNRLGALLDTVPSPTVMWTRHDPCVDLCGSPGFVAEGEPREPLVDEAVTFLMRRFSSVNLLEEEQSVRRGPYAEFPMVDAGRYDAGRGRLDVLFARHSHLRRKAAKFRNKGGTVDVVEGTLAPADREAVLHCIRCVQNAGLLRAPYQSNYVNMVDWATRAGLPGLLHFIARLDGQPVGYHAFVESGRQLLCLSGGFDRTRHTTYHAYENVLLEAMRHADARGLSRVLFGPVSNPSKAAVMPDGGRLVVRVFSRWPAMLSVMRFVVARSAMRPELMARYRGVGLDAERAVDERPCVGASV